MMKKTLCLAAAVLLAQSAWAQEMVAENAYARATVGQPQSGAFVTLNNTGSKDNVLLQASVPSDIAQTVELHTHVNDNGVMRMREVKDGIVIKAGSTVELKPGSFHVMLFGLKKDLTPGQTFPLTLKFKNGDSQTVQTTVRDMSKTAGKPHGGQAHGAAHVH